MKLPNGGQAQVPQAKITEYLLSFTHEDGRPKAQFFTRFGFTIDEWERLAEALREHARQHHVSKLEKSPFGKRYVIEGSLLTPDGRNPLVRVVWFVEDGSDVPHLVTAYPLRR